MQHLPELDLSRGNAAHRLESTLSKATPPMILPEASWEWPPNTEYIVITLAAVLTVPLVIGVMIGYAVWGCR